ncbi:ribonuclease D, partial [Thermodesulfobacteriota bacterium]
MNDTAATADFLYIDSNTTMLDLVSRLEGAGEIALDTEADSLHHYFEKVCLIQLSTGGEHFIVDPLCGMDLSPMLGLLARRPLVLHGADYDIRMMRSSFGFLPETEVFDTMLAARLLGHDKLGLASLAERFFGVELGKAGQKSDWSRRPLSAAQLRYASDDTRHLLPLAERLRQDLEKLGRINWHQEACESMVQQATVEIARDPDTVWRIKGSGKLPERQLNFLRALWHWRNGEARAIDRPPFHVFGNRELLDLAAQADRSLKSALADAPKLHRRCRGNRLEALRAALREAAKKPKSEWPERLRRGMPLLAPKALMASLRAECDRLAKE